MIAEFKTLEVKGLILPKEIVPGSQWEYKISMEGSIALPGTFSLTMQDLGPDTITVSAGTFGSNKLQAAIEAQIDVDLQGSPVPYTVNGSSILWHAPGIGLIKTIENIELSGPPFTSATELQSLKIPRPLFIEDNLQCIIFIKRSGRKGRISFVHLMDSFNKDWQILHNGK